MKENLLTLYNRFGSPLLKSFVRKTTRKRPTEIIDGMNSKVKFALSESFTKKITSKNKTDILNDNDFQMFEDFESFEKFFEEKSKEYNLRMFKDLDMNDWFDKLYFWGFNKIRHPKHAHQFKEYNYTDKFRNSVILWISDIHSFVEEEGIEEDYEDMELPQGLLLQMFVVSEGPCNSEYMIIDPQFKSITRQEIPNKFIPYKSITPAFVERLMKFLVSFVNYFNKSPEESIMKPLGETHEEFSYELTTEMIDNLLTNTIFPEIVKNM